MPTLTRGRNPNRVQINPRISADNRRKLRLHVVHRGDTTEAAVVDAALTAYWDNTYDSVRLQRRIERLAKQIARIERNLGFVSELHAAFIRLWLAHTPEMPASSKAAAERSAKPRYERLLDFVAQHIATGKTALTKIVPDELPDPSSALPGSSNAELPAPVAAEPSSDPSVP